MATNRLRQEWVTTRTQPSPVVRSLASKDMLTIKRDGGVFGGPTSRVSGINTAIKATWEPVRLQLRERFLAPRWKPFATLRPAAGIVDVTPTVDVKRRKVWLAVSEHSPLWSYDGSIRLSFAGLGLPRGTYHLVDLSTGQPVAAQSSSAGMCVPLSLTGGDLTLWELSAGAGPGTSCPAHSPTHPPVAWSVAGADPQDLAFLALGANQHGSDANLSSVVEDGVPAVATWTLGQSGAIPEGAYLYMQLNPSNPLYSQHHGQRSDPAVDRAGGDGAATEVRRDGV